MSVIVLGPIRYISPDTSSKLKIKSILFLRIDILHTYLTLYLDSSLSSFREQEFWLFSAVPGIAQEGTTLIIFSLDSRMQDMLRSRDREISSLHHQLDTSQVELAEMGRVKEMALKENRRLQDDLATMARENQVWRQYMILMYQTICCLFASKLCPQF